MDLEKAKDDTVSTFCSDLGFVHKEFFSTAPSLILDPQWTNNFDDWDRLSLEDEGDDLIAMLTISGGKRLTTASIIKGKQASGAKPKARRNRSAYNMFIIDKVI
jgi:hypothetical protein